MTSTRMPGAPMRESVTSARKVPGFNRA
jgi:hypothetical protein